MTASFDVYAPHQIHAILSLIREQSIPNAHYFGLADEALLRVLCFEPGFTLTVTDYHDRWKTGVSFWREEGDPKVPPRPAWLEGVPFYQEGMPFSVPLLITDLPFKELPLAQTLTDAVIPSRGVRYVVSQQTPDFNAALFPIDWVDIQWLWFGTVRS